MRLSTVTFQCLRLAESVWKKVPVEKEVPKEYLMDPGQRSNLIADYLDENSDRLLTSPERKRLLAEMKARKEGKEKGKGKGKHSDGAGPSA